MIGSELAHAVEVVRARMAPLDAGAASASASKKLQLAKDFSRVVMQVLVSLLVLIVALWILLTSTQESVLKLASGLVGTVVGYWLR